MICLLSNINIHGQFLVSTINKLTSERVVTVDGYNTWVQDLISGDFLNKDIQFVYIILDGYELLKTQLSDPELLRETIFNYANIIEKFVVSHPELNVFVSTLDIPQSKILPVAAQRYENYAMALWQKTLAEKCIALLQLTEAVAELGRSQFYSPRVWYLGSIPFSMHGEKALAQEVVKTYRAVKGIRKKCLVLDLDNTLWGGVIGEDGVEGIALSTSGVGACYRDFQLQIKSLKEQGILLAIVSKNNLEDAQLPFRQHPDMVLKEDDFIQIFANWLPKATNIANLAVELNLGLDSFVFVDDNPIERESVKASLPEIVVPDFPTDAFNLPGFMHKVANQYFSVFKLTEEDSLKTLQYRAEKERSETKKQFVNINDYLKSLEMKLHIERVSLATSSRAAQLTQKTNQFNLTTKRYTESDINSMINDQRYRLWIASLSDKFGDYGYIILCIATINNFEAHFDTFLMSCRVMGRFVESNFLQYIENELQRDGITQVTAEFIKTNKNTFVSNFWENCGYVPGTKTDQSSAYHKVLATQNIADDLIVISDQSL